MRAAYRWVQVEVRKDVIQSLGSLKWGDCLPMPRCAVPLGLMLGLDRYVLSMANAYHSISLERPPPVTAQSQ